MKQIALTSKRMFEYIGSREIKKYEEIASSKIPIAKSKTPMDIVLNPEAIIPLPNFLVISYIKAAATNAAAAEVNDAPSTRIEKKRFVSNILTSLIIQHFI